MLIRLPPVFLFGEKAKRLLNQSSPAQQLPPPQEITLDLPLQFLKGPLVAFSGFPSQRFTAIFNHPYSKYKKRKENTAIVYRPALLSFYTGEKRPGDGTPGMTKEGTIFTRTSFSNKSTQLQICPSSLKGALWTSQIYGLFTDICNTEKIVRIKKESKIHSGKQNLTGKKKIFLFLTTEHQKL